MKFLFDNREGENHPLKVIHERRKVVKLYNNSYGNGK